MIDKRKLQGIDFERMCRQVGEIAVQDYTQNGEANRNRALDEERRLRNSQTYHIDVVPSAGGLQARLDHPLAGKCAGFGPTTDAAVARLRLAIAQQLEQRGYLGWDDAKDAATSLVLVPKIVL